MTWTREAAKPQGKPYKAIRCLDCKQDLPSRAYLRQHKNHDVRYVNQDGSIDE